MATAKKPKAAAPSPQQQLAPAAPPAAAENDEAREAIVTIQSHLAEFDVVEAGLKDLETKYAKVAYDCKTAQGLKDATEARWAIRKPRFAVETARKAAKAPVLELGRTIDSRAKAITTRLLAIETPIDQQIVAQEVAEQERIDDIRRRIAEIEATPRQAIGKSVEQLEAIIDGLNTLDLESFQEFKDAATAARTQATIDVTHLLTQARQAAELARLQAEREQAEQRATALQAKVGTITNYLGIGAQARNSARLQALIASLEAVVIDDSYAEVGPAAREEKARVLAKLGDLLTAKQAEEAARAKAAQPQPMAHVGTPSAIVTPPRVEAPAPTSAPEPAPREFEVQATPSPTMVSIPVDDAPDTGRPTDAEILAVLADHYDVDARTAAGWLRTFDAATALAQQSLIA